MSSLTKLANSWLANGAPHTNHVQVVLVEATEHKEDVSTELAERTLRTNVLRKPFNDLTLREERLGTEQLLQKQTSTQLLLVTAC